jgi:hypothetical protein
VFVTDGGWLRIDLHHGVVAEGPYGLPDRHWRWLHDVRSPHVVVGTADPSRVLFLSTSPGVFDPISDAFDGPASVEGMEFSVLGEGTTTTLVTGLADLRAGAVLPDGRLYLFDQFGTYRSFDLAARTAESVHSLGDGFGPLVEHGFGSVQAAWSIAGDPDAWAPAPLSSEVPSAVLRAIRDSARDLQIDELALTATAAALSGLRVDAFNPAGRYGLLQLTADDLGAAGWAEPPAAVLTAPEAAQRAVLTAHVTRCAPPPNPGPAEIWAALLTPGEDRTGWSSDTVIAAAGGPRAEVLATYGALDRDGDGQLTIGDLEAFLFARLAGARFRELERRLTRLA